MQSQYEFIVQDCVAFNLCSVVLLCDRPAVERYNVKAASRFN